MLSILTAIASDKIIDATSNKKEIALKNLEPSASTLVISGYVLEEGLHCFFRVGFFERILQGIFSFIFVMCVCWGGGLDGQRPLLCCSVFPVFESQKKPFSSQGAQ